jgi:hypothetical protein
VYGGGGSMLHKSEIHVVTCVAMVVGEHAAT